MVSVRVNYFNYTLSSSVLLRTAHYSMLTVLRHRIQSHFIKYSNNIIVFFYHIWTIEFQHFISLTLKHCNSAIDRCVPNIDPSLAQGDLGSIDHADRSIDRVQ